MINQDNRAIRIPRLPTPVGFRGSVTRQEVGGPVCMGVIIGIAVYTAA